LLQTKNQPKYSYVKFFTTFVKKRPLVQNSMLIFFKKVYIYMLKKGALSEAPDENLGTGPRKFIQACCTDKEAVPPVLILRRRNYAHTQPQ
jgi:hypothetical protein